MRHSVRPKHAVATHLISLDKLVEDFSQQVDDISNF